MSAAASRRRSAASRSGCVDPQCRLMLRPSGWLPMTIDVAARGSRTAPAPRSSSRRWRSRSPSVKPCERRRAPATRRAGDRDRRRRDRAVRHGAGSPSRRLPGRVGDDRFDLALDALGELLAASREHLDAVVLERIVRRGDHDAGVVARRPRRDRRRPASARRRRSSPWRPRRTRRARAPLRSSRPTRACRGRPAAAASPACGSARTSAAPSRRTVADRADRCRPCRARRRCQTGAGLESVLDTGDSHLHGRRVRCARRRRRATRRRAPAACSRRRRGRRDRRRRVTASRRRGSSPRGCRAA